MPGGAKKSNSTRLRPQEQTGSALLVVLFIAVLLAIAMGTYLALTSQGNTNVKRSIGWNAALPLAEAGVEEALSHVVRNTNDYAVDGWKLTSGAFRKQRLLGDGYYSASISGFPGGTIYIRSTGYGAWKGSNYIARTVRVTAQTPSPFIPIGLVATNIIFGGNFGADSFDSTDPLHSTGGYYDPSKATAFATIATPGPLLSLGGGSHIRGYVATPPGGSVTMSGSSFVGDQYFSDKGIEPGHQTNYTAGNLPPVLPPFDSTTDEVQTPTNGMVNGVGYTYVLQGGNYFATNLDFAAYGKSLYVGGDATLYVTGNIDLSTITFATNTVTRPHLNLFVSAPSVTFAPSIVGGTPPQFWVFGLPSCTTMTLVSKTTFIGVIYAPTVDLRAEGNAALCGAIVAATFECFGGFDFHYDSSTSGIKAKDFRILSWAEL